MLAMLLLQTPAEVERFLAKVAVDEVSDCWVWVAGRFSNGYGCFKLRGGSRLAHRVAYTTWRGPIPDDKVLDHVVCDSPPCCNPWHTEPRTTAQNVLREDGPCVSRQVDRARASRNNSGRHSNTMAGGRGDPRDHRRGDQSLTDHDID